VPVELGVPLGVGVAEDVRLGDGVGLLEFVWLGPPLVQAATEAAIANASAIEVTDIALERIQFLAMRLTAEARQPT
jgi:hypothetical protein